MQCIELSFTVCFTYDTFPQIRSSLFLKSLFWQNIASSWEELLRICKSQKIYICLLFSQSISAVEYLGNVALGKFLIYHHFTFYQKFWNKAG